MSTTYKAEIKADSISPDGVRLTTFVLTMPRIVLAEFNTHRMLSRNAASSRAIPVEVMLKRIEEDPYIPPFAKNQRGMQPGEELSGAQLEEATRVWLKARDTALNNARVIAAAGVHKQWANRLVEPWMWTQVVASATEWTNFFALRCHEAAAIDIRAVAWEAFKVYQANTPTPLDYDQWHMPFLDRHLGKEAMNLHDLKKVSVGRCARVSYLNHEGDSKWTDDIKLHDRLLNEENPDDPGHWSPFEHVATPIEVREFSFFDRDDSRCWSGNFYGWRQYRKFFPRENVTNLPPYLKIGAQDLCN